MWENYEGSWSKISVIYFLIKIMYACGVLHSLMVASIVIVMLLILLHVMGSTIGECYLQLVGILCSAADVLVCDCLPLPI